MLYLVITKDTLTVMNTVSHTGSHKDQLGVYDNARSEIDHHIFKSPA